MIAISIWIVNTKRFGLSLGMVLQQLLFLFLLPCLHKMHFTQPFYN
ncbi:hypothetical protein GAGA_1219 [Paraglaciecola agarilytica NO2]|uniref:Uncharacterized protein n=1 Tax=Paraglaciecola agarilytica NO2 TaxID=1125747 RepID=A0ABQ0I430_9ALTE|nr:hypothetical protein GAGA_1219 [Paraglaciecola agarilytica NO2]